MSESKTASKEPTKLSQEAVQKSELKSYWVLPGKNFYGIKDGGRKEYVAGDEVQLTDAQAENFKDRFAKTKEEYRIAAEQAAPEEEEEAGGNDPVEGESVKDPDPETPPPTANPSPDPAKQAEAVKESEAKGAPTSSAPSKPAPS